MFISSRTKVASFSSLVAPASSVPPKQSEQGFLFEYRNHLCYTTANHPTQLHRKTHDKIGLTPASRVRWKKNWRTREAEVPIHCVNSSHTWVPSEAQVQPVSS